MNKSLFIRKPIIKCMVFTVILLLTACNGLPLAIPEAEQAVQPPPTQRPSPTATATQGSTSPLPTPVVTATPTAAPSPLEKIKVGAIVDARQQFIQTYQTTDLPAQSKRLNLDKAQVKFESWSPDGHWMLLLVETGEALEGRYATTPPDWGPMIIGISDLWLANTNGIPLKLLAETVFWNAWSPDSKTIAYIHRTVADGIFNNELWIVQVNSGKREKLFSDARSIAWLDNQTLIFVGQADAQLRVIEVDSQKVEPFVVEGLSGESAQIVLHDLSPDRQYLALNVRGDAKVRIAEVINNRAKITAEVDIRDALRLSWSPDSQYLAIAPLCSKPQHNLACQQIHIIRADGTTKSQLNHLPDTNVGWSPDSRLVAFQEANQVYVADIENGQAKVIHTFAPEKQSRTRSISWSPDGKQIGLNQEAVDEATILTIETTQ